MNKQNYVLIESLRHELHAHPELSNHEVWTKQHLIDFLREHTSLEIHDEGKWFWAVRRAGEGKPNIAFRADFDALPIEETCDVPYRSQFPGVAHKCGHDGHSAALCGLGLELEEMKPDKNVFLLFQHAEETGDGAYEARRFITENNIEEIYAFHNQPGRKKDSILIRRGSSHCTSKGMSIEMIGTPTHASLPENGKNPAFALAAVTCAIPGFVEPSQYKGLVLCTVIQLDVGELAFGTAASRGVLRVTIRGEYEEEMDILQQKLEELSRKEAEKYGLECNFSYQDWFPQTRNDERCYEKVVAAAAALGYECDPNRALNRGSEDFGHYQKLTRGAIFHIGGGENVPNFHTSDFDFTDSTMETAVEMFKKLIDMME